MQQEDISTLKNFYTSLYKKYGYDSRSTGYSVEGQQVRYGVLSQLGDVNNKTILEVGSGLGHFYQFLKKRFKSFDYTGYDINENFVKETRDRIGPFFENRNILMDPVKDKFDFVFSIGILNTKIKDNEATTKELMERLYQACKKIAALSMTSIYVDKDYIHDHMFYYDPSSILRFARQLSKKVLLIHDYLPHDFTVVLKKI